MISSHDMAGDEPDRLASSRRLLTLAKDSQISGNAIADELAQNRVTVRGNLRMYGDVFRSTRGLRGRHEYGYDAVRSYVIFDTLREDELRFTAIEAITILRMGDLDEIWEYIQGPLAPLMRYARALLLSSARPAA